MTTFARIVRFVGLACLCASLSACKWGMTPQKFPPAQSPDGARVAFRVQGDPGDRYGELFSVDSVGVVLNDQQLMLIHWTRLRAMDVRNMGRDYDVFVGETVTPAKRARIALLSRFPQGLSGPLLQEVLVKLNQPALVVIK